MTRCCCWLRLLALGDILAAVVGSSTLQDLVPGVENAPDGRLWVDWKAHANGGISFQSKKRGYMPVAEFRSTKDSAGSQAPDGSNAQPVVEIVGKHSKMPQVYQERSTLRIMGMSKSFPSLFLGQEPGNRNWEIGWAWINVNFDSTNDLWLRKSFKQSNARGQRYWRYETKELRDVHGDTFESLELVNFCPTEFIKPSKGILFTLLDVGGRHFAGFAEGLNTGTGTMRVVFPDCDVCDASIMETVSSRC